MFNFKREESKLGKGHYSALCRAVKNRLQRNRKYPCATVETGSDSVWRSHHATRQTESCEWRKDEKRVRDLRSHPKSHLSQSSPLIATKLWIYYKQTHTCVGARVCVCVCVCVFVCVCVCV